VRIITSQFTITEVNDMLHRKSPISRSRLPSEPRADSEAHGLPSKRVEGVGALAVARPWGPVTNQLSCGSSGAAEERKVLVGERIALARQAIWDTASGSNWRPGSDPFRLAPPLALV
jgi:hypothetical protein